MPRLHPLQVLEDEHTASAGSGPEERPGPPGVDGGRVDPRDVDKGLVGRFNDFGELEALDREARAKLRYVMITHANDPVGHFGLELLVRAPDWLGPAAGRAATVPSAEQWRSPTTFVQTLVDMKNSANVIPGSSRPRPRLPGRPGPLRPRGLPAGGHRRPGGRRGAALRAAELERKHLLDAAKDQKRQAVIAPRPDLGP